MAQLVEPRIASLVARRVAGDSPLSRSYLLERLVSDLDSAVPRSEELVAETSGINAPAPVRWGIIDRATWAETNISAMGALLSPIADRVGDRLDAMPVVVRMAQQSVVSVEVGVLLGYVSRRVLGQYDLLVTGDGTGRPRSLKRKGLADDTALYFVGPNVVETERRHGFVPNDFALWVALHEVTHRYQFDGVPWLRERFLKLVRNYVDTVDFDARTLVARLARAARRLASGATPPEERNPVYLLASDDQRGVLDDIQALMTVVEGHGNYVMDTAGEPAIPSMRRMRAVFDRRRDQLTASQRVVSSAIGLDMKLRQYEIGQRFCEAVVERAGPGGLAALWVQPDNLPSLTELREPERWLGRVA